MRKKRKINGFRGQIDPSYTISTNRYHYHCPFTSPSPWGGGLGGGARPRTSHKLHCRRWRRWISINGTLRFRPPSILGKTRYQFYPHKTLGHTGM